MLKQAKIKLKSLIYDDSGVAMAYTIMVFLFFFMLCVSTYAMSENIRQRMELQNACDAAAYSGAVVQADMLSRIAVLNRALSWTYAETNKRHMDYTVDQWLKRTAEEFRKEEDDAKSSYWNSSECKNSSSNGSYCPCGTCGIMWKVGYDGKAEKIRLNGNEDHIVSVGDIENARNNAPENETDLYNYIDGGYNNIDIINKEIKWIKKNINIEIGKAIEYAMSPKHSDVSFNYYMDGRWKNSEEATYIIAQTNEEDFLNYSGNTKLSAFNIGCDVWWTLENENGFRRYYSSGLKSELGKKYIRSHWHDSEGVCHSSESSYDISNVYGKSCYDSRVAQPVLLDKNYFGKSGSIIVATKRPLENPFTTMFDSNAKKGLYGAFNGKNKDMWVISAARAGVRFNNDDLGYYRVQWTGEKIEEHGYKNNVWNLCEDDWDAVMIPVARAWNNTIQNNWGKDENGNDSSNRDTSNLLDAVKKAFYVSSPYGEKGYVISNDNPMRH